MVDYEMIRRQIKSLAEESADYIPVMANVSALLFYTLPDINWAGFYLVREEEYIFGNMNSFYIH